MVRMTRGATLESLSGWARALLDEVRVGHIGLVDDEGRPRVLPVTFAVAGGAAWTAIDHKPKSVPGERLARVRWLEERPASTLTVDRYDDDWSRLAWVQLVGSTAVLEATRHPEILAALAERYPQYRERPPGGPLLRLTPERVLCWRASEG
jgi:PPOX class probable F420-dependent enzyme